MNVWVLHQPEYDCDIIHGIFTSPELAKQAESTILEKDKWLGLLIDEYKVDELQKVGIL